MALPDISVLIGMAGGDTFSRQLGAIDSSVAAASKNMDRALTGAMLAGAAALGIAIKAASDFESQMADVNTLLDRSDTNFESLKQGVLGIATELPVSMQSLTKGLYDLVSAGADSANAIGALELASKAATAGVSSVDVAIRSGMANVNAYGLSIDDLSRIYDLQFATVKKGVLTYEQLSNAIGNVLPSSANLGVSLEDLYGSLAHVTKAGIDAQSASTYLARAFESMAENKTEWAALGAAIFDASGKFRGLEPIIGDLATKLNGLTTEQKLEVLASLDMEKRAAKAILTMVNNYDGFTKTMGDVSKSAGEMTAAFDKQKGTFENLSKVFKNQLQVVMVEIGNTALPILTEFMKNLTENPEKLKQTVKTIADLVINLGTLALAIKGAMVITSLISTIKAMGLAWNAFIAKSALSTATMSSLGVAGIALAAGLTAIDLMAKNAERSIRAWDEANKLAFSSTDKVKAATESMSNALFILSGMSEDTRVKVNGSWTTAGEAAIFARQQLEEFASTGKPAVATMVLELEKLTATTGGVIDKTGQLKDREELLASAGITTTAAIKDQIVKLEDLRSLVPKTDIAYKELTDKINNLKEKLSPANTETQKAIDAIKTLGDKVKANLPPLKELTLSTDDFKVSVEKVEEPLEKTSGLLDALGIDAEGAVSIFGSLWDAFGDGNEAVGAFINVIGNIAQGPTNAVGIITSAVSFLGEVFGDTHEHISISIDDLRESLGSLGLSITQVTDLVASLGNEFESDTLSQYANEIAALEEFARQMAETMANSSDIMSGWMQPIYDQTIEQIQTMVEEAQKLTAAMQFDIDFTSGIEGLQYLTDEAIRLFEYFGEGADLSGIKQLIQEQIILNATTLAGLDPASQAYIDLSEAIARSEEALAYLNGEVTSFNEDTLPSLSEELASLGIETEQSVRNQIENWSDLFLKLDEGSYEYEQVRAKLEALYAKLGEKAPWQIAEDEAAKYTETVKTLGEVLTNAGIETEKSVLDQIDYWEDLLEKVDEGSYEYEQIQKKLEGLYGKLGLSTPWQLAEENAQRLAEELAGLETQAQNTQDAIKEQRMEIERLNNLLAERNIIVEHIDQIKAAIDILNGPDVNFDSIEQILIDLGVKTGEFAVQWEDALSKIFSDYDQFNIDMTTASDTIDQLLYFNVDLDSTQADESINALIFRWRDYLSDLDPNSDAYKKGTEALGKLTQKFVDMGGVIDEQSAIDFNISLANTKINELTGELELMPTEQEIQLSISNALTDLNTLLTKLGEILTQIYGIKNGISNIKWPTPPSWFGKDDYDSVTGKPSPTPSPGITAHSGYSGGGFGVEVPALIKTNEAVLTPNLTAAIGPSNVAKANTTGDPRDMMGGTSAPVNIMVNTADPLTAVRFVDNVVTPRSRETNRNTITIKRY